MDSTSTIWERSFIDPKPGERFVARWFRERWSQGWEVIEVTTGKVIIVFDGISYILDDEKAAKYVAEQLNQNFAETGEGE